VHHLDSSQDRPSGRHRLAPEYRPNSALDSPMILLDSVIEVGPAQKPFGSNRVAALAEPELDRIPIAVDRKIRYRHWPWILI
jgi:hypothetical protein